jgi:hypothetical protein
MNTDMWLERMVDVANNYGIANNLTVEELLDNVPEIRGEIIRTMRRPHGNITEVFFSVFNTKNETQDTVVGVVLSLNNL